MRFTAAFLLLSLLPTASIQNSPSQEKPNAMTVKKITPVLFAAELEPCVKFWVERLGFTKTAEVPEGDRLGFVILQKGNVEVMYQSYASADKDVSTNSAVIRKGPTFLYVEVDNLDDVIAALKGVEIVMPLRKTFYGSTEIGVKDPAGHYITFAQLSAAPSQ